MSLPVLLETHCLDRYLWIAAEQVSKPAVPLAGGGDSRKKILEDGEYAKDPVVGHFERIMPLGVFLSFRDHGLEAQLAVPEAAVMSADVSDYVQRPEPGLKDSVFCAVFAGNQAAEMIINTVEKRQHPAEAHDLAEHPEGRHVVAVAVFPLEMIDERLPAAAYLVLHFTQPALIPVRRQLGEKVFVLIAERAVRLCEMVYKLGPDCYLHPLDGIHDQNPQLAVKGVMAPDKIEGRVFFKYIT